MGSEEGPWGSGDREPKKLESHWESVSVCDDQSPGRTCPREGRSEPYPWGGSGSGFVFSFPRGRPGRRCRSWAKGAALLARWLPLGLTSAPLRPQMQDSRGASSLWAWPVSWCWLAGPSLASSGETPSAPGPHSAPLSPHPTRPLSCVHSLGNPRAFPSSIPGPRDSPALLSTLEPQSGPRRGQGGLMKRSVRKLGKKPGT